ncbi:MAG: VOC family protein [Methylococcales bacterium]|nr:VOC family protein [Methylococcales bacterium]
MTNNILSIHHSSLIISNTKASLQFYCGILGLETLERAPLPFDGAWLDIGGSQQLHLLELENMDPTTGRPEHGGKDRHVALYVTDIEAIKKSLNDGDVSYTLSLSGRKALFCRDLDGNALEFIQLPTPK